MTSKQKRQSEVAVLWIAISLAVSVAAHMLGIFLDQHLGSWRWSHAPFHSFVETSGACIGVAVAGLLIMMHGLGRGTNFNLVLAFGLIAMSLLDAGHALVNVGKSFVWLHSIATFAGGCLFALVCFPQRFGQRSMMVPMTICLSMIGLGGLTFLAPQWVPQMVVDGEFTFVAKTLNIGGGILMLCGAAKLAFSYYQSLNRDDLLFSVHCLLFGGAAIMFEQSQLWDFSWWWWHVLRLMAYVVALVFAIESLYRIQTELIDSRTRMEAAYHEASRKATEISRRFAVLESAIDNHSICSITNERGIILDVNEGFCNIAGYRRHELIGNNHRIVNSGHHPLPFWKQMWGTISRGKVWNGEICNRTKDGSLYWVASTIIPVINDNGKIEKYISLRFDITKQKMAESELKKAIHELEKHTAIAQTLAAQAEQASLSKSEFLANMSHEIRTPLSAILGYSDLLLNDHDVHDNPERRDEAIQTIQRNGKHLLAIINDILDMSKIESGKLQIEMIPTSPSQIVSEVVQLLLGRAQGKGIQLCAKFETPIPETIQTDPTRLRQVLLNLVGNAIKFTEFGRVEIQVAYHASEESIQFCVVDTGIGMTPDQLEVIRKFAAFSQADASTSRKFGGTGLGLRISNSLTRLMRGSLSVDSTEGIGSIFTAKFGAGDMTNVRMILPDMETAPSSSGKDQHESEAYLPQTTLQGLKILYAEDGPDNQRLVSFLLKKSGAIVDVVENGRIAVETLLDENGTSYDVVLMDMQMPEMDGYEATRVLRQQGFAQPIVALTAHAMSSDQEKCLSAGCDDFATKPIDRQKLIATIAKCAQERSRSTGLVS